MIDTRALFERAVTGIPATRCRDIWDKWLDYENQYGDIGNAGRVFQRVKEIYPDDINSGKNIYYLANRWKVLNLNIVGDVDLGLGQASLHARKIGPISTVSKSLDEKVKRLASLEAVNPENYPRPDFSKYVLYKPEAALVDSMADDLPTIDFDIPEPITNFLRLLPTPKQYIGPRLPPDDVLTLLTQLPIPLPVKQEVIAPPVAQMVPAVAPVVVAPTATPVPAPAPPQTNGAANHSPGTRVDPRLKRKAEGGDDQASSKIKKEEG
jgi:cleavage stimulation factor subunit 3